MRTPVILLLALLSATLYAQSDSSNARTGILRGSVIDERSQAPVPGARISVKKTTYGAISSETGEYRIEHIPVGHYVVTITAHGYTSVTQEITISSARQSVLDFSLREHLVEGDSITVTGSRALDAVNRVAAVSVQPFSVEDVNRYAAAFADPSRMAASFAGVFAHGTTNNFIVVRGGSPTELLWKIDGIEIPNPNHFGSSGSTGGIISTINSLMLANSDFLTGAFPAEYGTKLSAVFDLHTRNGNDEHIEGMAAIGFSGIEGLIEGPLGFTQSSYLASYRHSTISFLRDLGLLDASSVPDFDDAMLKLKLGISDEDRINVTGMWGKGQFENADENDGTGSSTGVLVAGIDWQHIFSDGLITNVRINRVENRYDNPTSRNTIIGYSTADLVLHYLPNNVHNIDLGLTGQLGNFEVENSDPTDRFDTTLYSMLYRAYANWNWHIQPELVLNAGVFSQFIEYNHSASYEPRVSLAWSPYEEHTFSAAFGVHRQPQPLEFAEAKHYVLGYSYRPYPIILIKLEGYLKDYSDVPIHKSTKDSYSFMNEGFERRIDYSDLINAGEGRTYGLELSFFKHYSDDYYITTTASYVRQEFAGSDGIRHFGTFDNRYILNLLAGYDFVLSSSSTLILSEKFTFAGGGMYTPIDLDASRQWGGTVYDSTRAFGARNPAYVRLDINAEFRFNWSSSALTVFLSVLNALNIDNVVYRYFRYPNSIVEEFDLPILPILGLRYQF